MSMTSTSVVIARDEPQHVRRQWRRARLRGSAEVEFVLINETEPFCVGALLNLSADGLACRVPSASGMCLSEGALIRTCFKLDGRKDRFDLPAHIVYVEPAASVGLRRVGLQFDDDPTSSSVRRKLRSALRNCDT